MSETVANPDLKAVVDNELDEAAREKRWQEEWHAKAIIIRPEDCTKEVECKRKLRRPRGSSEHVPVMTQPVFDAAVFQESLRAKYVPAKHDLFIYSRELLGDIRQLGFSNWNAVARFFKGLFGPAEDLDPADIFHLDLRQNGLVDLIGIGVFKNVKHLMVGSNPLESLEGIEALQYLETVSLTDLWTPRDKQLKLKGLDKLSYLKAVAIHEPLERLDLKDWETVKVMQALHEQDIVTFNRPYETFGDISFNRPYETFGDICKYHFFKYFALSAVAPTRYVNPDSSAYRHLIRTSPQQLQREEQKRRFGKYKAFMRAIGFNVPFARSFGDYGHITETINTTPSLNLTAFVEDTKKKEVKFVKLYRSKSACERDVMIQRMLIGSGLVNDCDFVDLKKRGIDEIAGYSQDQCRRALGSDTIGASLDDKVTIARDGDGVKLGYGLVTPFIKGENFEAELKEVKYSVFDKENLERSFFEAITAILALHSYANANLKHGTVPVKDYRVQHQQLFNGNVDIRDSDNSYIDRASILFEAMRPVYERLAELMSDERYASFVHGDFHARNLMKTEEGQRKIFDFERSCIGLKVEDLVRFYVKAQEYDDKQQELVDYISRRKSGDVPYPFDYFGVFDKFANIPLNRVEERVWNDYRLSDAVKERFFTQAFGEDYDRKECEEMFALVTAHHYISAMADYDLKAGTDKSHSKAWIDRKYKAAKLIADCLHPYLPHENIAAIIKYLHPNANPKVYSRNLASDKSNERADRVMYASQSH